jgi:hypothetical protein
MPVRTQDLLRRATDLLRFEAICLGQPRTQQAKFTLELPSLAPLLSEVACESLQRGTEPVAIEAQHIIDAWNKRLR